MVAEADLGPFVSEVIRPAIHPRRRALDVAAHHLHGEPVRVREALGFDFEPVAIGVRWGARWDTTWFRIRSDIPDAWDGEEVVALVHLGGDEAVGFSAEGQIWDRHGVPIQGLHHHHREYRLAATARGGDPIEFYVEAAANPIPPWQLTDWPLLLPDYDGPTLYVLEQAELATVDRGVEALYLDLCLVQQLAGHHAPERAEEILQILDAARRSIDPTDVAATAATARALLAPVLARGSTSGHIVTAIGHAHIDSAWLWPVRETKRKCARTFSNQLRLMERYPEHRFACSQAVQYQWIKDGYPALYEQIREEVQAGRWEPVGGMWVEPDTNLASGESLVRQLVHGKRFFSDEFGVETHELWIPDVFGYSAALPQIANQAGITSIITQKMSWNDTNVFPHSTFWWEGHDGSRLLAHFPPSNTYNGVFSVREVAASQDTFRDHGRSDRSLYPFGFGDGGGGPTAPMLELGRRMANLEGLPRIEIGTVAEFLDRVREEAGELATWVGELYLETHRATLTTHADVKKANRRCEESLRAAEMWCVAAGLDRRDELDAAWKLLLLQQFHDIIPGSSIHWVYQDTARDHAEVAAVGKGVIDEAHSVLSSGGAGVGGPMAFNAASHDRREVVELDGRLAVVSVPACGWAGVDAREAAADLAPVLVTESTLENDRLRVTWDRDGLLTSVWDREYDREVLHSGQRGNLLQLHEDHPQSYDAWNVDRSYLDHVTDLVEVESVEIVERGPLRAGLRFVRRFGASTITQTMRLSVGSRRIEFHTEVDWQHRHCFLKVAFPVAVRSARATYEIQHGHVERPTVANTSWDTARFEVCGHRWADLSEADYGVALLNDCKYGYDIRGHVMRLSLLRGPGYPDPEADRGRHRFAYALLPHPGDFRQAGVVSEAEAFNLPLAVVPGRAGPTGQAVAGQATAGQVVAVDRPGVSVEAVKWADRSAGIVVRLCEVWGSRRPARVTLKAPFRSVTRTDLLERDLAELAHDGDSVLVALRPFELVTLKFGGTPIAAR